MNGVVTVRDDGGAGGEDEERLPAVLVGELPHQSESHRPENASNLHANATQRSKLKAKTTMVDRGFKEGERGWS